MTDRELLEAAAKAAGNGAVWYRSLGNGAVWYRSLGNGAVWYRSLGMGIDNGASIPTLWRPLTDDGDALRLAVKLSLLVNIEPKQTYVSGEVPSLLEKGDDSYANARRAIVRAALEKGDDPYANTRRAIVRAAADIGAAK